MTQDALPAYLRGGSALKKPPRRGRRAGPLEIFFAAACAWFSALIYFYNIPAGGIFILLSLLAFFTGAYIELKTGHRFASFGYPALVLAFKLFFYAFFGIFWAGFWNLLIALLVLVVFFVMRRISRNGVGAAVACIVFCVAGASGTALRQMSFDLEGDCKKVTDDVLEMGGILWDIQEPFALACDVDGQSVFLSAPGDMVISKIINPLAPEALTLERRDSAFVMDLDPKGDTLVALLAGRRELAYYSTRPMEFLRGISTDSVHCDHPIAIGHDRTRDNTLVLCQENRNIIFGDISSRNDAWSIEEVAALPSGMAISQHMERAYITDLFRSGVQIIDLDTNYLAGHITTGFSSAGIVASPDGKTLYIGRPLSGRIEAWDAESKTRERFRVVLRGVDMLKTDAKGRFIFAAARAKGTVAVWDLESEVVYGPYKIGKPINDMAYCFSSKRLYISTPCAVRYLNVLMLQ
jgi:hypothetical protein